MRKLQEIVLAGDRVHFVLVTGAAGLGKTRLGHECLRIAEEAGFATAKVTATHAARGLQLGAMRPLLPELGGVQPGNANGRPDLLRRCAAAIFNSAASRRLVLLIDDAHLLDDTSAALIYQLATRYDTQVVTTLTPNVAIPNAMAKLREECPTERIELSGLSSSAIEQLVHTILNGNIDPALVTEIVTRSEGNPLYLRELVLAALDHGTLLDEDGIWRLKGPLAPSERLVELVKSRLRGIKPAERDVLEIVAFAERLGRTDLMTLAHRATVEALEQRGLLLTTQDGRRTEVRIVHAVYADVLRSQLPRIRASSIARSLANVVEGRGARHPDDLIRVALWRLEGGGANPEMMLKAARVARWQYDFLLAERLARAAQDGGGRHEFEARLLAAQVAILQGRSSDAEVELRALADEARDDSDRGRVAVTRFDDRVFNLGDIVEGLRICDHAERSITCLDWRNEIRARRVGLLLAQYGPRAAIDAAQQLLSDAEGHALVWASIPASFSFRRMGRLGEAFDAARKGLTAREALSEPIEWYPWMHLFDRTEALVASGDLHDAEKVARTEHNQGIAEGSTEHQAWFAFQLARTMLNRGRLQAAENYAREAIALFREAGRLLFVHFSLSFLTTALALRGEVDAANSALESQEDLDVPSTRYFESEFLLARGWTAAAAGDLSGARCFLEDAANRGGEIGDLIGQAEALHSLARIGESKLATSSLTELAGIIEGRMVRTQAMHAQALCQSRPDALQQASRDFEAMGADLLAAEAAADAAVVYRRIGEMRTATAAERRARILADRCEGASTPALQSGKARTYLTSREREIALLAAGGRPNKEIADELCISVRTVENCLLRSYQKLSISGRHELKEVFASPRPTDEFISRST